MKATENFGYSIITQTTLDNGLPEGPSANITSRKRKPRFSGWKFGVIVCAATVGVVLVLNIVAIVLVATRYEFRDGLYIIHDGSCSYTKRLNMLLHLGINIIGAVLLAASNYCMQGLSSPSRAEVDEAHKSRKYLDIGIHGLRNIFAGYIDRRKVWLWVLLGLSSLPLHLM